MANATQIYSIVNDISKQIFGAKAVTVVDVKGLMSVGADILESDKDTDAFVHALSDRIGKTIISIRGYTPDTVYMVWHSFDFGVALQKIYVDLPQASENTSWLIGENGFTPQYAPVIKPEVKQKIFKNITTFEIDITIPDNLLKTAFLNAEGMAVLITAIFTALDNSIANAIEACTEMVRAAFIGRKFKANMVCQCINLLADYNTKHNTTLTAALCMENPDFLRWSSAQIRLWRKRMAKMSILFNEEGYKRHTPESELVLLLLDEYDCNLTTYLEADTYHKELVALDKFTTVPYWQGSGESYAFADTSSINIKLEDGTTINETGVIALAYDYQAMGVTIDVKRNLTERNSRSEYTNYYNKVTRGYFNDMSENGIVFYVKDTPIPEPEQKTA